MAEDGWLGTPFSLAGKTIWVAGHKGLAGSAMMRRLSSEGCKIITSAIDLRRQDEVERFVSLRRPGVIVLAAAKVGGIGANMQSPADFLYDNIMIEANVLEAARRAGVEKLLFLGSSCIYPRDAEQPVREDALLSGPPEPTNEAYAVAKIAGVKLCQSYRRQHGCDFISAMPCNLYGPGDKFDARASHVIPALMMKALAAKDVLEVWGTGRPLREFLYIDDLAEALVFVLKHYSGELPVNIGSGQEVSIAALARSIADVCGFRGEIVFDPAKPDGTPRKIIDSSRILNAGWRPRVALQDGLVRTLEWYKTTSILQPQKKIA